MLFLVGAIALALVALGTSWGTIGTVATSITATAWLTLAFRPVEAGRWSRTHTPALRVNQQGSARGRSEGPAFVASGHR